MTDALNFVFVGSLVWSANAGDSRAILCSSSDANHGRIVWKLTELSHDHKPDDPAEYQRILARGGRVETYRDEFNN